MTDRHLFENPQEDQIDLSGEQLRRIVALQRQMLEKAVIGDDHKSLLDELCSLAESFTTNAVASIMKLGADGKGLNVLSAPSLGRAARDDFSGLRLGDGSCGNAVFHNEPMYVRDTCTDARWQHVRELAKRHGIFSCFAFPIRDAQRRSIGSFAISCLEPRHPDGFHQALLENCASIAGVILQRQEDKLLRERAIKERITAEKFASLGGLAGGIAHDFNNLLSSILAHIEVARGKATEPSILENLDYANKGVERARSLTGQLLTFARGGEPVKETCDVVQLIREAGELVLGGTQVCLELEVMPNCDTHLPMDRVQIGQVFQNLLGNAKDAIGESGKILVSVSSRPIAFGSFAAPGNADYELLIDVTDTGCGMSPAVLERVFEPYFSTKDQGTGFGLAMTQSIVTGHGGNIAVRSKLGEGSCFSLRFPCESQVVSQGEDSKGGSPSGDGRQVIVMDDDDLMRGAVAGMLRQLGYKPLLSENGEGVFEIVRREGIRNIEAMILDLTIADGLGGVETARAIRRLDQDVPMILSSGFADSDEMQNYKDLGFSAALAKPFDLAALQEVLTGLLRKAA